jgi:cell division protein FtsI (penicillin-binding protein 3)
MKMMNAKGAAAILMDARTGEILALASLPTSTRTTAQPLADKNGDPGDSPLFNRAVQGVYELGSTFKIFATAQAMDLGLVNPDTMVDANAPMPGASTGSRSSRARTTARCCRSPM